MINIIVKGLVSFVIYNTFVSLIRRFYIEFDMVTYMVGILTGFILVIVSLLLDRK